MLGRDSSSTVLRVGRPFRLEEVPALKTDDRLLVAEWPRTVEVSVSEEMVDKGRMYSTLSEKPTRAREGGRGVSSRSCKELASRNDGWDIDLLTAWPKTNCGSSEGVTGALPVRGCAGGFMMEVRSWEEMAPDRRWACPRRPAGGPGRRVLFGWGRTSSPLVGLVLINVVAPGRLSPPINSLPPRLCPTIGLDGVPGVAGCANGDTGGEVAVAGALGVPAGLKLKSGKALMDFPRAWAEPRRPVG